MPGGPIALAFIRGLLEQAAALGVDTSGLLEPLAADDDPEEARTSLARFRAVWLELERRSGDEDLGLRMGQVLRPGTFSVLDYAVRNSATLGDAFGCASRYSRILHSGITVVLGFEGDLARVGHQQTEGATRHGTEWLLATWVALGRQLTGENWSPRLVRFQHPAPARTDEHARLFAAPVSFGAETNEIVFDRRLLALPIVEADPRLREVLEAHALRKLVEDAPGAPGLVERVRVALSRAFAGGGDFRLEAIADRLGMSPRTLQRHLKREGVTSYQKLVNDTRRDLAVRYLRESPIAIAEAAFLLGFSDPSAFYRAFRRWTGATPKQFRDDAALA